MPEKQELSFLNKWENFNNAFFKFEEVVLIFTKDNSNEIVRDSLIQRFEFTVELSWKLLKAVCEYQGFEVKTPRESIKTSFEIDLVEDFDEWINILKTRNILSHTYDSDFSQKNAKLISEEYYFQIKKLKEKISKKYKDYFS